MWNSENQLLHFHMKGLICGLSRGVKVAAPSVENEPLAKTLAGQDSKAKCTLPFLNQKSCIYSHRPTTAAYLLLQAGPYSHSITEYCEEDTVKSIQRKRWVLGLGCYGSCLLPAFCMHCNEQDS